MKPPVKFQPPQLFKKVIILVLLAGLIASFIGAFKIHWMLLLLSVAVVAIIYVMPLKRLFLEGDSLTLEYYSLVPWFHSKEHFSLRDLQEIEYRPKRFDRAFTLIDILTNTGIYRGNTHPAYVVFRYKDGSSKSLVQIGNERRFREFLEVVKLTNPDEIN